MHRCKMKILLCLVMTLGLVQGSAFDEDEEHFVDVDDMQGIIHQDFAEELTLKKKSVEDIPGLTHEMLNEALGEAKTEIHDEDERTPRLRDPGTTRDFHHRFVDALEPARLDAMIVERTTKKLASKLGLSHEEGALKLQGLQIRNLHPLCMKPNRKAFSKNNGPDTSYRTVDGKGNNIDNQEYGRTLTPFSRILKPNYADRISKPRVSKCGSSLRNSRRVSFVVFKDVNHISPKLSHMNMIFGQFVVIDIVHGAQPRVDCSETCGLKGECFGIPIPTGDKPFEGRACIQLKRDAPACIPVIQPREQITRKTSYIDGSQVYGDDPDIFESLRDPKNKGGIIERKNPSSTIHNRLKNLLPKRRSEGFCRTTDCSSMPCFKAGDKRANENPGLSSLHTFWSREHNRIVGELKKITNWNSDKLYFEARKIVGAMLQHIVYNEYLPSILDRRTRRKYNLVLSRGRFFSGYDRSVDASIINSFAVAAFRFGHSQVQNVFHRFTPKYTEIKPTIPMNRFFDPTFLYQSDKGGVDSIMLGLAKDASQKLDGFFAKAVQEQLVRSPGDLSDLPALNIQRGREHGLPGYNKYREWAGLKKATSFKDLKDQMTTSQIKKLVEVYDDVNDIDLYVGGLYEKPVQGGIMGRTFSSIIAEQFKRLRIGDRFWYENPGQFTPKQLKEIKKVTLARVMCDNGDNIEKLQKFVLRKGGKANPLRSCGSKRIPKVDLRKWKP